ncbi:MAG: glycosyltransferase [Anaerolineae bacterium]|nr:glycosyltransferase [Anaerolineae bacterium]
MHLCYVANPFSIHTRRWVRIFVERGHTITLIGVAPQRKPLEPGAFPPGIRLINLVERYNLRIVRYLLWGLMARRIVRDLKPDILHAHQVAGNGWVAAATGYHPFIATAWGSDLLLGPPHSWVQRQLARWVLRKADAVTCVSAQLAETARLLGANPKRVAVAHWGIDTRIYSAGSADADLRQQIAPGFGPVILSIRALRPVYNPLTLAKAIPGVLKQHPEAYFIIRTYAADAEILKQFQQHIVFSGATNHVTYLGELDDEPGIAALYRLADIAISIPASDGTPISVLEAMACGAAPIVSDLPSLKEWITDGENGLLVPVGDAEALAAAIVRLLHKPQLREQFRQRNQEIIQTRANREMEMAKMEQLYLQLLR